MCGDFVGIFSDEGVDNGSSESIGGVVRLRNLSEMEMKADHFLDLRLVGLAVAADSLFDLVWGVFEDGQVVLFSDEKADATSFSDGNAGSDVLFEEELFD